MNETPQQETKTLREFIKRLTRGAHLTRDEARSLIEAMLEADATDAQIAAALVALNLKTETADELAGMADALRSRAARIKFAHANFIDTAGTGGSASKTFNISTAAAFVIAGAGLPVAKHGARAATSQAGSADVLEALGVSVEIAPEASEKCLNEIGVCFMFAPLYHAATARVARIRRELGVRTAFNLLGPLTNPAGAPRQIIGVSEPSLVEPVARALVALGTERAWVVHGLDGLDEITLAAPTLVAEATQLGVEVFELTPEAFGVGRANLDGLRDCCGDARTNALIIKEVLEGRRDAEFEKARLLVLINAAAALHVAGVAGNLYDAEQLARESVDSGAARKKLQDLIEATKV